MTCDDDEVEAQLLRETWRVQDKPYRTRGNPGWVLKKMALKKVKRCCICGDHETVELHHEDGDWKNYRSHNLNWYCKQHHQQADNRILHNKENTMTKKTMKGTYMKWTEQHKATLRQEIQKGRGLGMKSSAIFQDISENSETLLGQQHTALNVQKKASFFKLLSRKPSNNTTVTPRRGSKPREVTYTQPQVQQMLDMQRMVAANPWLRAYFTTT